MAKLTTKTRKTLSSSVFALPGRRYPIQDKVHAQNAKARAKQMFNAGKLSSAELATVNRKANAKLKATGAKTITKNNKTVAVKKNSNTNKKGKY